MRKMPRAFASLMPVAAAAAWMLVAEAGFAQDTASLGVTAYAPDATVPDLPSGVVDEAARLEAEETLKGAELDKLRRDMELSAEKQAEIAAEIAGLASDQQAMTDQLVQTAAKVQSLEQAISDSEGRLARSADNEAHIKASLDRRKAVLIEVLATAQRIGRQPPPALVVTPGDALEAVRSAILVGSVLPGLRVEAEALESDLTELVAVRTAAEADRDKLKADAVSIAEERQRLTLLIEEKRKTGEIRTQDLAAEKARAESLAENARSVEELITSLRKDLTAARKAQGLDNPDVKADRLPSATEPGRLAPAIAFVDAKGKLAMPVRGVAIQPYGADNGLGATAQGTSIATRAGARVVAPADGRVVYAGPFRSYGQLLILDVGDGYHVVLAGMERLDVSLDQFVLTGEPVGTMGNTRLASATAPDASFTQPVLYVEFRKDGTSIDPSPWWVGSQDRKVSG